WISSCHLTNSVTQRKNRNSGSCCRPVNSLIRHAPYLWTIRRVFSIQQSSSALVTSYVFINRTARRSAASRAIPPSIILTKSCHRRRVAAHYLRYRLHDDHRRQIGRAHV